MLSVEKSFKIFDKSGCGKDLNRPQFLKAILNLIYAKYLRPKAQEHIRTMVRRISSTVSNSKLQADYTINDLNSGARYIFERLIPKFASKRTWQEFRVIVQKPKTSQVLINSMKVLRRIYS